MSRKVNNGLVPDKFFLARGTCMERKITKKSTMQGDKKTFQDRTNMAYSPPTAHRTRNTPTRGEERRARQRRKESNERVGTG